MYIPRLLNELLKELVTEATFRSLFGISRRFHYEELLLRVFAFAENYEGYNGKLAKHLNDYMNAKKSIDHHEVATKRRDILRAISILYSKILDGKQLPKISKATTEAILVGIFSNINFLETLRKEDLIKRYETLGTDPNFSVETLK